MLDHLFVSYAKNVEKSTKKRKQSTAMVSSACRLYLITGCIPCKQIKTDYKSTGDCKRKAVHQATAYYQKLLISLVYDEAIKR